MKRFLQVLMMAGFVVSVTCQTARAMNVQIREGRPFVDGVYVNGHGPYKFLLDTGTTLNHLDLPLSESIGLRATFRTTLASSAGVTPATGSHGIEVVVGPVSAVNQTFLFSGVDAIEKTWPDIQGILGQDFLSHFDYLLDLRSKQLEFGNRPFDGKGTQIPYKLANGRPAISTSLGWLVLDSGVQRLTRFGVQASEETLQMRTVSGTIQLGTVPSTLTIAGHCFWRGDAMAVPQRYEAEAGADGLLPAGIFKSIYVSNSEGYVVLQ
jgi:Aspartyl protease